MKENYTHLLVIVDRSGSMEYIASDMRGALNEFFKSQAALPGECLVDYIQFDHTYELMFQNRPVGMCEAVLVPNGMTALYDAIGKGIVHLGRKLREKDERDRPDTVVVAIVTDGMENSSIEHPYETIREMIKHQTDKYNWNFVFLGANMDAVDIGHGLNITHGLTYGANPIAVAAAGASMSNYVSATRSGINYEFSDEEREKAVNN